MTASIIKLPTETNTPDPEDRPNGGRGQASTSLGILGACGLLVEFKHGIPAICAPFANCTDLSDFFLTVVQMEDGVFVGIIAWLAMLVASSVALGAAIKPMIGIVIAQVARKSSRRSVGEE
jgi:hypothetical protein